MTRTPYPPAVALFLLLGLCLVPASGASRRASKPAPAKASKSTRSDKHADRHERAERGRDKADSRRASAKDARADRHDRASKNDRRESAKSERRETARERREREREEKRASAKTDDRRDGRRLSKRDRLLEARREAERRRREEIARRIEAARQAAIARAIALARIRAYDQSLRDETAANILKDETTGEDPEVRRAAIEALGGHAGSVVVMDPKTGRVYTVVNQDWALRRGFKPCSTVKLVTGLAGLAGNVIDPVQTVNASLGSFRLDLTDALAFSNNQYFQRVSGEVGFDRMMSYAHEFGLGEATGINHFSESPGRLPVYKAGYAVNHMGSHGDDVEVTTLQLANMASAIANGGKLLVPHLPRTPQENVQFQPIVRRQVNVPAERLQRLIPGMVGAVNYGTGKLAYDPTQTIAGKTGTCIGQGSWLGLFTSFAPVQDPHLAVAVITRGSGERGRFAAAVAGKVYRSLNTRFGNRGGSPMLANDKFMPHPKIDPRRAAALNDEDNEADAYVVSEATGDANAASTGNAADAPTSSVKSTLSPVQTRPTDVTTRPSLKPSISTTPSQGAGTVRPRRVLETTPER